MGGILCFLNGGDLGVEGLDDFRALALGVVDAFVGCEPSLRERGGLRPAAELTSLAAGLTASHGSFI